MKKWMAMMVGTFMVVLLSVGTMYASETVSNKHVITVYGKYSGPPVITDVIVKINGYTFSPDPIADPNYSEYVPENLPLPWVVEFTEGNKVLCKKVIKEIPPNTLSIRVDCP